VKILFAGIIGRYPYGGVTWCSLMYLLGLRALGHEVLYIEDTGETIYDPDQNSLSKDPAYGLRLIESSFTPFGLQDQWAFINWDGVYYGKTADEVRRYCADADLYINLSGGSWFWRDEYARIPRRAFVDSDPAFTQIAIANAPPSHGDFFRRFTHLFTFGSNIGTPASPVPVADFTWHKTWQPVVLDEWTTAVEPIDRFSTVMTWQIESFADIGGNKDQEFVKVLDLPSRTSQHFELAVNGPQDLLRSYGWATVDAMKTSRTLWDYRDFIQRSKAEFSVAKHTYVATHSGWFSDRTECFLAAGRPAVVQDTGWTEHVPAGQGVFGFTTVDEALAGIDRINSDYRAHSRWARELAAEHFDASRVLSRLLETCSR
jgi:hypothetical protein